MARTYFSSYEIQVLFAILRKTYGWHKKEDWITGSQLVKMTGINKSNISRTLKRLIKRNMIIRNDKKIAFQKDYDKWEKLSKQITSEKLSIQNTKLSKQITEVIQIDNKKLSKQITTKETKETSSKKTIQKKRECISLSFTKEIINYLNERADKDYRPTTELTRRLIKARLKEGYPLEAFKWVIDVKCKEWKGKFTDSGKAMEDWLRPKTLFGTNFESYLNQSKYKEE